MAVLKKTIIQPVVMRRIGSIKLAKEFFYDKYCRNILFKEFHPFKIEWDLNGIGTFVGLCDSFDEAKEGTFTQEYEATIHDVNIHYGKSFPSIKFQKI